MHSDPTQTTTMTVLLSARNQSTSPGYRFTVCIYGTSISEADGGSEHCFIKGGENRASRLRQLQLPPRTRTFAKTKTRAFLEGVDPPQAPDKGQHGFSSSEHDDKSGKEVSIRRAGLNNSSKGPSLGPLTRKCNLLAPARCTRVLTAILSSLFSSCRSHAIVAARSLGSLYPPSSGKKIGSYY